MTRLSKEADGLNPYCLDEMWRQLLDPGPQALTVKMTARLSQSIRFLQFFTTLDYAIFRLSAF